MCTQDCNSEIFRILCWKSVWRCAAQVAAFKGSQSLADDGLDLSLDMVPGPEWHNTVTVTSKGSIIIRLSWSKPVSWDRKMSLVALNACKAVCCLLENCC